MYNTVWSSALWCIPVLARQQELIGIGSRLEVAFIYKQLRESFRRSYLLCVHVDQFFYSIFRIIKNWIIAIPGIWLA